MDLPMEWAFGAGRQAVTFVTRVDKDWYVEHYSTYYSALRSWGPTPGQDAVNLAQRPRLVCNPVEDAVEIHHIEFRRRKALQIPSVHGLVIGRSVLFPPDDDVASAVDTVLSMVRG